MLLATAPAPHIASVAWGDESLLVVEVRARGVVSFPERKPGEPPTGPDNLMSRPDFRLADGRLGRALGPNREWVRPYSEAVGQAWPPSLAAGVEVKDARGNGVAVQDVRRKTEPGKLARTGGWEFAGEEIHTLYVRLGSSRASGELSVSVPGAGMATITADRTRARAEGIRINQVGFRPSDPDKSALFTLWTAGGEPVRLETEKFAVLSAGGRRAEFPVRLHHSGEEPDTARGERSAKAPVYLLDFSSFRTPGEHRLHIPGVGVSRPFRIAQDVWRRPFLTSVKGLYYQRNSIRHTAPWSTFEGPRAFHPEDGFQALASSTSLMDSGNGLNALGTDEGNFKNLVAGATTTPVPNVWGGYKDAGDWDTRIQHLDATRMLLETVELAPQLLREGLNIPESRNNLPDLIDEAMWNVDHFRRMQTPEGGIRGGFEFSEHPLALETSWTNSLPAYAYAPDPWSSWLYAATAARLAHVLGTVRPALAPAYRESAVRAYAWAALELARLNRPSLPHQVRDARALAALELLRLTGTASYEADAREALVVDEPGASAMAWGQANQMESAALMARAGLLPDAKANAQAALRQVADGVLAMQEKTSIRLSLQDENAWPGYSRDVSGVGLSALVWTHMATGEEKYLKGLLKAVGYGVGINPKSLVYTTGVGQTPVQNPFMLDPYYAAESFPPGITVYGPLSTITEGDGTWFTVAKPFVHPPAEEWPGGETYFDAFWTIMMGEFTIHQSIGPTLHAWGYLAGRKG